MLTSITLQNFKGIGERMTIPLRPITLLFGANSTGKSTIVQAIHFAREILERRNLNPDRTLSGGDIVDLGGFLNLLHNRDDDNEMRVRFDLDLSDDDLPEYQFPIVSKQAQKESQAESNQSLDKKTEQEQDLDVPFNISSEVSTVWVEIGLRWSRNRKQPIITLYETGINGLVVARLSSQSDGVDIDFEYNENHPLITPIDKDSDQEQEIDRSGIVWVAAKTINHKRVTNLASRHGDSGNDADYRILRIPRSIAGCPHATRGEPVNAGIASKH